MDRPILYKYFEDTASLLMSQYTQSAGQSASYNLGQNREYFCATFLQNVLPPKFRVVSGEIMDSLGNRTGQLDTIIIRDDTPCLHFGRVNTYLVEGVLAVIEVKSNLQREKIKEAGETLASVRRLKVQTPRYTKSIGWPRLTPLRIVFAFKSASTEIIQNEMQNWPEVFDLISVLELGAIESQELADEPIRPESLLYPYQFINGEAASLAYLYYHLTYYGNSILSREIALEAYFVPIEKWKKIPD